MLLLDGMNEIPPGQRRAKAAQIRRMAEDERFAAVVASCRERDYSADYALPFDTLTLQPLAPPQVRRFLHRAMALQHDSKEEAEAAAEARFWQIAGGDAVREVWHAWERAGAGFELFWSADDIPRERAERPCERRPGTRISSGAACASTRAACSASPRTPICSP